LVKRLKYRGEMMGKWTREGGLGTTIVEYYDPVDDCRPGKKPGSSVGT
jgi:hypothetical protein